MINICTEFETDMRWH